MLNMSTVDEEKIEEYENKTLEATELYLSKKHSDEEYLKAIDRIAPCSLREIANELNDPIKVAGQHLSSLERKRKILKIGPLVRGSGGKKYGRSDLFGGTFSRLSSYLIIIPYNINHLNKLTKTLIDSMPEKMSKGEKAATTHHLKEMNLPEEVYNAVRASYIDH